MSTVNLYDVLNLQNNCTKREIKDSYIKLVKEFHPERPNGDRDMFELITHAYNVLINSKSRKDYDHIHELNTKSMSSHFDLKDKSQDFYKALESDVSTKKSKEDVDKDFKKLYKEMDKKHGYKRKSDKEKLDDALMLNRLKDLETARGQDDIENMHCKIFDDGRFDLAKFNAAFDEMNKVHTELVPHTGNPFAYNTVDGFGASFGAAFGATEDYGELYSKDEDVLNSSMFGPADLDIGRKSTMSLTKDMIETIKPSDYTKGHNYKDPNYSKSIDELLRERELETKLLEDRSLNLDSNQGSQPVSSFGGYGIFEQLGMDVDAMNWQDNDEDLTKKYKKLLELRKQVD